MKDGGAVFPYGVPGEYYHKGISLWDYHAAQAVNGLAKYVRPGSKNDAETVAYTAGLIADALIAEKEKREAAAAEKKKQEACCGEN